MSTQDILKHVGACVPLFLVALALDIVGLIILLVGIFANVRLDNVFYGDFLIYTGALIIFVSVFFWLFWYVGNVPVCEEDWAAKKPSGLVKLARKFSERLSHKLNDDDWARKRRQWMDGQVDGDVGRLDTPSPDGPRKATRVTFGRAKSYHNEGYDDEGLDSPAMEKKSVEQEGEEEVVHSDSDSEWKKENSETT